MTRSEAYFKGKKGEGFGFGHSGVLVHRNLTDQWGWESKVSPRFKFSEMLSS